MDNVTELPTKEKEIEIDFSTDDLPKTLKDQLIKDSGNIGENILETIKALKTLDKDISINNILIAYYRMHNVEIKRATLVTRLNKMVSVGKLKKGNKKGFYLLD